MTKVRFVGVLSLWLITSCATSQNPEKHLAQIALAQEEGELQTFYLLSERFVREFPDNSMVDKIRYDWALQLVSENLTTPKSRAAEQARTLLREVFESAQNREQKFMAGLVLMKFSSDENALRLASRLQLEFRGDSNLPQVLYWLIQRSVNNGNVQEAGKYVKALQNGYPEDPYLERYLPVLRRSKVLGSRFPFPASIAEQMKDRWVLIDFWASFCEPCIEILPELKKLRSKLPPDRFTILSVSIDDDEDIYQKFIKANDITWPSIRVGSSNEALAAKVGVVMIPTYFVISPDGVVVSTEESSKSCFEKLIREAAEIKR